MLRAPGWHIDGLQGDEVPVKLPVDFQVIWSNAVPTEYTTGPFDIDGVSMSTHNIFDHIAKQIDESDVVAMESNLAYMHSAYLVHRAAVAKERVYRRFVRVNVTHVPVTSTNMTINPDMTYHYPIHSTTGAIPAHLK